VAHVVRFNIPERSLGNSDIKFKIRKDGDMFGTLRISKGSLEWSPTKAKKLRFKIGWTNFDKIAKKWFRTVKK
jgi:hypothetical protein